MSQENFSTEEIPNYDQYIKKGWALTFQDEFDGTEVSTNRWNKLNSGYKDHGRLHHYLPEQVFSSSGTLKLQVDNNPFESFPYRSGAVTTQGLHEQLYGKFEIRARLPEGQGFIPAIWLLPKDHSAFPEIDIVEMLGQLPSEIWHVAHKGPGERNCAMTTNVDGREWHLYTLDWSKDELIFYIDGIEKFKTTNFANSAMYLLMNVTVGGVWVGDPNNEN
ncbi:glycoside hydrolase family 16 protein [Psychrobacillus sp. BM2]|uniref:glycoside hydrolase family 16 protein n=1 Tax=Psychrobacillus sp. BM2 TaxID=3400421 RepID=UPI003B028681